MDFLRSKSLLTVYLACSLLLLGACGETPPKECISGETLHRHYLGHPDQKKAGMEKADASLLEDGAEFRPFRGHNEIDFPVHWMYFDRPIMLYIDDPPRLDDSLFVY